MSKRRRGRDRRAAIDHEATAAKEGHGVSGNRISYIVPDEKLTELGVAVFRADVDKDGTKKDFFVHVIPPIDADGELPALPLYVHYGVGPDSSAFLCPQYMGTVLKERGIPIPKEISDGRCPICEHEQELRQRTVAAKKAHPDRNYDIEWDEIKACRAYSGGWQRQNPKRYLLWVRDASEEKASADDPLLLYDTPTTVYSGMLSLCRNRRTGEVLDISDPEDGRVFCFAREGIGRDDTKYDGFVLEERSPTPVEWDDLDLSYLDVLVFAGYDEINTAFGTPPKPGEVVAAGDVADDLGKEFEKPSRRARPTEAKEETEDEEPKARRRRRSQPEPEEDSSDDDPPIGADDNGEQEELDGLRKKLRQRRAAAQAAAEAEADNEDEK